MTFITRVTYETDGMEGSFDTFTPAVDIARRIRKVQMGDSESALSFVDTDNDYWLFGPKLVRAALFTIEALDDSESESEDIADEDAWDNFAPPEEFGSEIWYAPGRKQ